MLPEAAQLLWMITAMTTFGLVGGLVFAAVRGTQGRRGRDQALLRLQQRVDRLEQDAGHAEATGR